MPFFFFFILFPFAEIAAFIAVSDAIGFGPAMLLCLGSFLAGSFLLRWQGLGALLDASRGTGISGGMLLDHLCLSLAAVLLIIPGFISDALAIMLIVPRSRSLLKGLAGRFSAGAGPRAADPDIIDGEFVRVEDPENDLPPPANRP